MLVESIVRKTLGLKRHCIKKVTEEHSEIVVYLFPDKRCRIVCSSCGSKGLGYDTLKERRWKHVRLWGVIVMAMFPIVSESYALKKNPTHLLKKAIGITVLLAGSGLIVLLAVPDLMLSFLFGKTYSGGTSLLRIFSLAMFFMALINILANFHLAIERRWFIFALLMGCVVEILLISFFHQSLITILLILTVLAFLICASLIYQTLRLDFTESFVRPVAISDFAEIKRPSI